MKSTGKKNENTSKTKGIKKILRIVLKAVLFLFLFSIVWVFLYKFVNPPVSTMMIQRVIQQTFDSKREVRIKKSWVSLHKISPNLINAVIVSEDGLFFDHWGFDTKQLRNSYNANKKKKRVRGGSTITMQTAKNVFLTDHRNYVRKGLEAYYTLLIELFWGKERIIEVYLNVAEWGDGIYGCEAASRYYFNKSAASLSLREASLLAACLPSPLKRNPSRPSSYVSRRASFIQSLASKTIPFEVHQNEKKKESKQVRKTSKSKKKK